MRVVTIKRVEFEKGATQFYTRSYPGIQAITRGKPNQLALVPNDIKKPVTLIDGREWDAGYRVYPEPDEVV